MNASQILTALERERQLLREFHSLSKEQLMLLDNEDIDAVNQLLDERADLMLELTAIESTLGTWIDQIRNDSTVSTDVLAQLRIINDDIVQLAGQVIELDEQTHWRLDMIKNDANTELRTLKTGTQALNGYERGVGIGSSLECRG